MTFARRRRAAPPFPWFHCVKGERVGRAEPVGVLSGGSGRRRRPAAVRRSPPRSRCSPAVWLPRTRQEVKSDLECHARCDVRSVKLGDVFGEGSRRYVFRAPPKGSISLDRYAPGSRPRAHQIERGVRTRIGEQSCALTDNDGIGEQVELVDQVIGEQPSKEAPLPG